MSMVHEHVYLEAPYAIAVGAFERRLGLARETARGTCVLEILAPLPNGRQIIREVSATTQRLDAANLTARYGIGWEPGTTARGIPTPGFNGTLTLRAGEDYSECELELAGSYEPPGGSAGNIFDEAIGRRIAHSTLNALLAGVGRGLRVAYEETEAAKVR